MVSSIVCVVSIAIFCACRCRPPRAALPNAPRGSAIRFEPRSPAKAQRRIAFQSTPETAEPAPIPRRVVSQSVVHTSADTSNPRRSRRHHSTCASAIESGRPKPQPESSPWSTSRSDRTVRSTSLNSAGGGRTTRHQATRTPCRKPHTHPSIDRSLDDPDSGKREHTCVRLDQMQSNPRSRIESRTLGSFRSRSSTRVIIPVPAAVGREPRESQRGSCAETFRTDRSTPCAMCLETTGSRVRFAPTIHGRRPWLRRHPTEQQPKVACERGRIA